MSLFSHKECQCQYVNVSNVSNAFDNEKQTTEFFSKLCVLKGNSQLILCGIFVQVSSPLCYNDPVSGGLLTPFTPDLGPKWVRLAPNETNPGLFQIRFKYFLANRAKKYWNLIWKSPGFVPFGANLTHFGPKCDISADALCWLWVTLLVWWSLQKPLSRGL